MPEVLAVLVVLAVMVVVVVVVGDDSRSRKRTSVHGETPYSPFTGKPRDSRKSFHRETIGNLMVSP